MRYEFHYTRKADHVVAHMVETLIDGSFERAKGRFWSDKDPEGCTVLYALGAGSDDWFACDDCYGPDECLPASGDDPTVPLPRLGAGARPDVAAAFLAVLVAGILAGCACVAIARAS